MNDAFHAQGYVVYPRQESIARWATSAHRMALTAVNDPEQIAAWLRCQGTWFVGVDSLPTGAAGQAGDVELRGDVVDDLASYLPAQLPMHKAQLSAVYPGYPKPHDGESEAAFRFRLKRDAAHVDGLHASGPDRRRYLMEYHAYILGIPLNEFSPDASPLVVWEGSHKLVGAWLRQQLGNLPISEWSRVDLTDSYQALRREIFETCPRHEISAQPGQAYVVHRHALHGIAPWGTQAVAPPEGRMVAYFRPEVAGDKQDWLDRF